MKYLNIQFDHRSDYTGIRIKDHLLLTFGFE